MFVIPHGDWIIVTRPARGHEGSRGTVQYAGLSESEARAKAAWLRSLSTNRNVNVWAMPATDY